MKSDFFQHEIQKALKERKQKQALSQNRFIEMNEQMLQLITNSQHVSTGKCRGHLSILATRGKALSLLNTHTNKTSRAQFNETHAEHSTNVTVQMNSGNQPTALSAEDLTLPRAGQQKKRRYAMTPS